MRKKALKILALSGLLVTAFLVNATEENPECNEKSTASKELFKDDKLNFYFDKCSHLNSDDIFYGMWVKTREQCRFDSQTEFKSLKQSPVKDELLCILHSQEPITKYKRYKLSLISSGDLRGPEGETTSSTPPITTPPQRLTCDFNTDEVCIVPQSN